MGKVPVDQGFECSLILIILSGGLQPRRRHAFINNLPSQRFANYSRYTHLLTPCSEEGDESDDDELVIGGMTKNYKCPLTLVALDNPMTS
jgi:hypothetical protein